MASYKIVFKRSVAKDLRPIPNEDVRRILARIDQLAEDPRPPGAERLTGDDKYRIRQGRYRILYTIADEIVTIADEKTAGHHRPTLLAYSSQLLTHLITVSAGITIVAFLMYGLSSRTVQQFETHYFVYTLPVVVYAVFRFAMLSMAGTYEDPTDLILRDRPFQITVAVWAALMLLVIQWGPALRKSLDALY